MVADGHVPAAFLSPGPLPRSFILRLGLIPGPLFRGFFDRGKIQNLKNRCSDIPRSGSIPEVQEVPGILGSGKIRTSCPDFGCTGMEWA